MPRTELDGQRLLDARSEPPRIVQDDAKAKRSGIDVLPRLQKRHGVGISLDAVDGTDAPDTGSSTSHARRNAVTVQPPQDFDLIAQHAEAVDDGDSAFGSDDVCQGLQLAIPNAVVKGFAERSQKPFRSRPTDTGKVLVCRQMPDNRLASGDQGERHVSMKLRAKFRVRPDPAGQRQVSPIAGSRGVLFAGASARRS